MITFCTCRTSQGADLWAPWFRTIYTITDIFFTAVQFLWFQGTGFRTQVYHPIYSAIYNLTIFRIVYKKKQSMKELKVWNKMMVTLHYSNFWMYKPKDLFCIVLFARTILHSSSTCHDWQVNQYSNGQFHFLSNNNLSIHLILLSRDSISFHQILFQK